MCGDLLYISLDTSRKVFLDFFLDRFVKMLSSIFGGSGGGGSIRSKRTSMSGGGPSEVIDAGSIRSQTTDATVVSPLRQLLDGK